MSTIANGNGANGVNGKLSKKAKRRAKKQELKKKGDFNNKQTNKLNTINNNYNQTQINGNGIAENDAVQNKPQDEIEYVAAPLDIDLNNPAFSEFAKVYKHFTEPKIDPYAVAEFEDPNEARLKKALEEKGEEDGIVLGEDDKKMSKRKMKQLTRLTIADLKRMVDKPEVVEMHDANSQDPQLLVHLKSYRNTVPVPSHWCQTRKYLQAKRGFVKGPFTLPKFIHDTGITKLRGESAELDKNKSAKQKGRERMQPKLGKLDIDYQILHDAFFRWQTKPSMTNHGDLYYEGREFEMKLADKRPGFFSPQLRDALNMKDDTSPPPWLFNMQRYGPPPAYPNLRIPGVNAPIPVGARWGFNEGEWGRPATNEMGQPLYGDVFGIERREEDGPPVDKTLWGQIAAEESDEEEAEAEVPEPEAEVEAPEPDASGIQSTITQGTGLETPATNLQLRKSDGTGTETPDTVRLGQQKQLYTVLEEKKTSVGPGMFGTSYTYVMPPAGETAQPLLTSEDEARKAKTAKGSVAVNIAPEELENLDATTLKRKYEAQVQQESNTRKEASVSDVDEVLLEQAQKKKRKTEKDAKSSKSYKF